MTSSSKCDVCHIPSCIFDDKENLFLSCVGPPTPHGSAWPTKSRLKLCLHWQHLISYSIQTTHGHACP